VSLEALYVHVLELDAVIAASSSAPDFRRAWAGFRDELGAAYQAFGPCAPWELRAHYGQRLRDWLTMFVAEAQPALRNATASAEQRYKDAIDYVRRALKAIAPSSFAFWEQPAYDAKTAPARSELDKLAGRWASASTDDERSMIARDAELLADRVEENLPGAPQDRARTNLYKGEVVHSTPATSYAGELAGSIGLTGNDGKGSGTDWKRVALLGLAGVGAVAIAGAVLRR
jgi:hypothetical protein